MAKLTKKKGILLAVCIGLAMVLIAGGIYAYIAATTFHGNSSTMDPEGKLLLQDQPDGSVLLTWPAAENADGYQVEVTCAGESLFSQYVQVNECTLPQLPQDKEATIRITSASVYENSSETQLRFSENGLEVTAVFFSPKVSRLCWEADPETQTVKLAFTLEKDCSALLYAGETAGQVSDARVIYGEETVLDFTQEGSYTKPGRGEKATFVLTAAHATDQFIHYGCYEAQAVIPGEELLSTSLQLEYIHEGNNIYTFTWNDASGDEYELFCKTEEDEDWIPLCKVVAGEERSFVTQVLQRHTEYQFRIIAKGEKLLEGSEYSAQPHELKLTTGASAIYCTVWPMQTLEVFSDPQQSGVLGRAPEASAYCVLGQEENWFKIRFGNDYGYIDSNYCMINLTEYLGDLCSYDIANSYASVYKIHGFELPGVTDKVVEGYENVLLTDPPKREEEEEEPQPDTEPTDPSEGGEETTENTESVPSGEETTESTGETTESTGETTEDTGETTESAADTNVQADPLSAVEPQPNETAKEEGKEEEGEEEEEVIFLVPLLYPSAQKLEKAALDAISRGYRLKIYDAYRPQKATGALYQIAQEYVDTLLPEFTFDGKPAGFQGQTYGQLMTNNGQFEVSAFLAKSGSRHNQGVALDLTLENRNGEELKMQTVMHDLSRFALTWGNNWNARILKEIMTGAGFAPLMTEWWHFQDDETHEQLEIKHYAWEGVKPCRWMADTNGWRYRDDDGQFLKDCTKVIDGVKYVFDTDGYAIG